MAKLRALLFVLLAASAQAQFTGYVGLQTVHTRILNNSSTTGRTLINANIGASYHVVTFCTTTATTSVKVFLEESPDGDPTHFTQITPVSSAGPPFTTPSNGNLCTIIRAGGYFSVLAINVAELAGGAISAWYDATAGPADVFPPAVNSVGSASPVQCDRTAVFQGLAPGATYLLVKGDLTQNIYVCGGTISFQAATTAGAIDLYQSTALSPACDTFVPNSSGYDVFILPSSPQLFQMNAAPNSLLRIPSHVSGTTTVFNLCLSIGAIGAPTNLTLFFAQS